MKIGLLIETLRHLRLTQVVHQLRYRLYRPKLGSETFAVANQETALFTEPIPKPCCYDSQGRLSFLNIADTFRDWNMDDHGALWTYNLNYMDWLEQEGISADECVRWIDKFIDELPGNRVGQDPYPIALRVINWAKFFSKHPECRSKKRLDSMYAQTLLLERKLEYHLLGNHLLEDAYALFIASIFFGALGARPSSSAQRLHRKAARLLLGQLKEQILPDGAHYEQSPMYHCIMLDRLLDCINFVKASSLSLPLISPSLLESYAQQMLGHLASIIYSDGSIPLFNDSALGIAPTPAELFAYAHRLGLTWTAIPLCECGYRRLSSTGLEVTIDVGNITATYQPGHSHADTFTYELRVDGQPIVVDTGVSTYNKNQRRQYERSTEAHNTVTVNSKSPNSKNLDSSQVWGGFRIGRRARVTVLKDEAIEVVARHDGFGRNAIHERRFLLKDGIFRVEDRVSGPAVSWLHLRPGLHAEIVSEEEGLVKVGCLTIKVDNCQRMELLENTVSTEYNRLLPCQVLALHFTKTLSYSIIENYDKELPTSQE